jgi:uncharacterized protein YxjI
MMSSNYNPATSTTPAILPLRETFGITDAEGNKYPDIIKAFLHARSVSYEEINKATIMKSPSSISPKEYKIQVDSVTRNEIKKLGSAPCIISFQERTYGNFALIRLFKSKKD